MTLVRAGDIDIEYESTGAGDPLVLVMGIGGQLTDWKPGFVELLAAHFRVITFDNRDAGLSSYSGTPVPPRRRLLRANLRRGSVTPPYELATMADDVVALLDAIGIDRAHLVGMSMGGMIAQLVTVRHPERVRSLCSIMSNTADGRHGLPAWRVLRLLAKRGRSAGRTVPEAVEMTVELFRSVGGSDWDEHEQRLRSTSSLERAHNPDGLLRQSLAIAAAPDRTALLRTIERPTLVIHGLEDTLVRPSGGVATARAIPDSRLLLFPGMGHDLPATRHREIVDAIHRNSLRC